MSNKKEKRQKGKNALKNTLIYFAIPLLLIILFDWKIGVAFFILMIVKKIIQVKRRKYFTKDTKGNKLSYKEFMKKWKIGIEGITPLQQAKTSLMGTWIVLSGILAGIVINALVRMKEQWIWIEVILVGSLILTVVQMIGGFQRYWNFKKTEGIQKQFEKDLKKELKKQK